MTIQYQNDNNVQSKVAHKSCHSTERMFVNRMSVPIANIYSKTISISRVILILRIFASIPQYPFILSMLVITLKALKKREVLFYCL